MESVDISKDSLTQQSFVDAELVVNSADKGFELNKEKLDSKLDSLNEELNRYTNHADKEDYAIAVASGLLSGIIDSLYVGEFSVKGNSLGLAHKQVNEFIQGYAKERGLDNKRLKDAIIDLEDNFPVAQDNVWKGENIGVSAKNHHLADLAHHPTPLGLASAIIVRFLRIGTFVNKEGKWHFVFVETKPKDILEILGPAVLTGFLNWLLDVAKAIDDSGEESQIPDKLVKLARLAASSPMIIEVIKCTDNWFGHLVSDMGGSRNTPGAGMGIPGIFISLLYEVSALPGIKDTSLPSIVNDMYVKQKMDLRHELGIVNELGAIGKEIGKQAVPVVLNELFVRAAFFIRQLYTEFSKVQSINDVDWDHVIPLNNRTIDRMITIASITFTAADTADAAIRSAVESGGNWIVFSGKFVTRFNYIGAGRATLAIVKEISNEQKEEQLLHEKRLLCDAKVEYTLAALQEYKQNLEERLADYLAEDITLFIEGFDLINEGINTNDSDKVIHGNVIIQKVLGREPQFTNQKEFDDLMDSDMPLQL